MKNFIFSRKCTNTFMFSTGFAPASFPIPLGLISASKRLYATPPLGDADSGVGGDEHDIVTKAGDGSGDTNPDKGNESSCSVAIDSVQGSSKTANSSSQNTPNPGGTGTTIIPPVVTSKPGGSSSDSDSSNREEITQLAKENTSDSSISISDD
jgi:hypothetical protein